MLQITTAGYDGEGLKRVYEHAGWMVGVKNYKPANDVGVFDEIERHRETDELFVLLVGSCVLLAAEETATALQFDAIAMLPGRVYSIPRSLWHTTITTPGTKLILIEDPGTGSVNTDVRRLNPDELVAARHVIEIARKDVVTASAVT